MSAAQQLLRPRLVYLPFRAMAETSRMILAHGGVAFDDEAVWGGEFQRRRRRGEFPWDKIPALQLPGARTVAQSGAIARWSARVAGVYPRDPARAALADSVYEMGQELCTINPLVNCYTGSDFERIRAHYFRDVMPAALPQLERELERNAEDRDASGGVFFAGGTATHADFNIFHHLDNAMLLEPELLEPWGGLERWYAGMRSMPALSEFLAKRPILNGIGVDPGLEDRDGTRVTQRSTRGRAWLRDGLWCFDDDPLPAD